MKLDHKDVLGTTGRPLTRAAQYMRMSTEHQRYSTEYQAEAIARYACQRGYEIVRTYADEGKSGLSLDGRDALKALIANVQAGEADYRAVLVYDVSRWGRFQDVDESAYYEFICREGGIAVEYCAEQFDNDGSLGATIIKCMKRAMAGEYSRELSAKIFAGQCYLTKLGFRQGGAPGFGLRRLLIDENGRPKTLLGRGQYKGLQSDRVILTPGPPEEVEIVREIYRLFVTDRWSKARIATYLNDRGVVKEHGLRWTRGSVHHLLTNENYIGTNIFGRTSYKLKHKRKSNPPELWLRAPGAFEPVIDRSLFLAAQHIVENVTRRLTDEQLLSRLSSKLAAKGALSIVIIDEMGDMPSSSTYRYRFGSLARAYELIGYDAGRIRALAHSRLPAP